MEHVKAVPQRIVRIFAHNHSRRCHWKLLNYFLLALCISAMQASKVFRRLLNLLNAILKLHPIS